MPDSTHDRVVLLSIHEEWADAILDGRKRYEYRKQPPVIDPPYRVVLYATRGPSELRGEAVVDAVITTDLDELLDRTIAETPHDAADIRAYFDTAETGTALRMTDVTVYETPVPRETLERVVPGFTPPQNFRYLDADQYRAL